MAKNYDDEDDFLDEFDEFEDEDDEFTYPTEEYYDDYQDEELEDNEENPEQEDDEDDEEDDNVSPEDAQEMADNIEENLDDNKKNKETPDEVLNDNSKKLGDTTGKLEKLDIKDVKLDTKTTGKLAGKTAGKATGKAAGATLKAILTNPYVLAALAIILALVILIVIIAVAVGAPFGNIDVENGKFDTSKGIKGDKFYGARVIYYDEAKASSELQLYYANLVKDFLYEISNIEGITLKPDYYTNDEDKQNNENFIAGIERNLGSSLIVEIIEVMDGLDVEISIPINTGIPTESKSLIQTSLNNINHFGYTANELNAINSALTELINLNKDTLFTFDGYAGTFKADISNLFALHYSSLNIISNKYYAKDVILRTEEDMIKGLSAQNYVAMIYMPKTDVILEDSEYLFYIDNEATKTNYEIKHASSSGETIHDSGTADSSWYEGVGSTTAEAKNIDINLSSFNSILKDDVRFLEEGRSIYSLLFSNSSNYTTVNYDIFEQLFASTEITTEDGDIYTELHYLPGNDTDYFYLTFNSNGSFQFCEFSVDYK